MRYWIVANAIACLLAILVSKMANGKGAGREFGLALGLWFLTVAMTAITFGVSLWITWSVS